MAGVELTRNQFERRWRRFMRPAGPSWRFHETYVKIRGQWVYLYRVGKTVDFRCSTRRDVATAKAFFRKAVKSQGSGPTTMRHRIAPCAE
jgi:transposase-like protein